MSDTAFKVFVYGTLKPGGYYWSQFCADKVSGAVPAQIKGLIYDLHVGYPGVQMGGNRWVQGYLLSFKNEVDLLQLDGLEGYQHGRSTKENEYQRRPVNCYSSDGKILTKAWAYEMAKTRIAEMGGTLIASGDWPL
jgi:gamma-glutamylcyclotransferase (GGCT)/AIG2-like uncharacterized protein YtfP